MIYIYIYLFVCLFEICSQKLEHFCCNIYTYITYYISSCNSILPIGIHMLPYVYLHRHCIDSKTSSHPAVCGMPASAFETAYWMAKYSLVDIATLALHLYQTSLHAFLMAYTCRKDPIMRHAHRHMIMVACTSYCPISKLLKLLAAPYTKHVDGKESDRPFRCSIGFRENPSLLACQKTVPEAVVYTRVILLSFNTFQTNPNGVC